MTELMKMARSTFLLTTVLLATVARADAPVRDHDIVVDDYFTLANVTSCAVSPDGEQVAYTEMRWAPPAEKRNIDVWVVSRGTKTPRRLTFDPAGDGGVRWSPNGKHLYFTSGRKRAGEEHAPYNGKRQVWRVSPDGGEPFAVTRLDKGIGLYDLSGDGGTLYYTTTTEQVDDEWKELRTEFKKLKYGHGIRNVGQVWALDLHSWRAKKLIDEQRVIAAMTVAPNQQRIAMLTRPDEPLIFNEGWSRVDVYDASSKKVYTVTPNGWRKNHPSPYGWLDNITWSDDGDALAFSVSYDGYPPQIFVAEWSGDRHTLRELRRPAGVTLVGGTLKWRPGSRDLCFLGEERARVRVYEISDVRGGRQGTTRRLTDGDIVVGAFDFGRSGSPLAVVMGTVEHTEDVFVVSRPDSFDRLTNVNPQVDTWKLPQISLVTWAGAHGDEVEGILELPPDYKRGTPLPLVVEIHGGPTAATHYSLRFWIYGRTLMAARGFALLSPNYRGSTGYGDEFMVDLVGHENDIEVEDILKGVDAMVERGIADPDHLAVMGWSNGGFLTNCLITATDRFKAASSGAGVLDMVIQWGTEDTPGHVINFMQGLPWQNADAYRAGSPMFKLGDVKTPTLIHVGENDQRVPPANARSLYRALRHYSDVPTELVVYPGEGHGLTKYKHRKAKMEWDIAWFDRYLRDTTQSETSESSTH